MKGALADKKLVQSRAGLDCGESEFRLVDDAIVAGLAAKKSVYETTLDPKVAAIASQQTVYCWISTGGHDLKLCAKRGTGPAGATNKKCFRHGDTYSVF